MTIRAGLLVMKYYLLLMAAWYGPLAKGPYQVDGHGRGAGRVTLYRNNFTLEEVELLRKLLLEKFDVESAISKVANADSERGYAIRIPSRSLSTLQSVVSPHIYPSLMYKIGL
nr:hypothetical protein [Rhizoctonia sp.]